MATALPPAGPSAAVEVGEPAARLGDDDRRARPGRTARPPARPRRRPRPRPPACTTRSRRTPGCRQTSSGQAEEGSSAGRSSCQPRAGWSRTATRRRARRRRTPRSRRGRRQAPPGPGARCRCAAHQRRPSAGAETTPATTSSPSISAIRVAQTGTPRTKFLVPSIGSMHPAPRARDPVAPNSSPVTASRGRARDSVDADRLLGGRVGVADRRQVRLGLDPQVQRLEAVHRDGVGGVGEHVGQSEVVVVRRHVTNRTSPFRPLQSPPHTSDQDSLEDVAQAAGEDRGRPMGLFHRRVRDGVIDPSPIPVPRFSIDGWTLTGTPLGRPAGRQPAAPGPARARDPAARRRRRRGHARTPTSGPPPCWSGRRARPGPVGLRGLAGPPGSPLAGVRAAHPGHREAPRPAACPAVRGRHVCAVTDERSRPPDELVIERFMPDGRVVQMPAKRSRRLVVLDHVARVFEPGQRYPEHEVNALAPPVLRRLRRAAALPRGRGTAVPGGWPVLGGPAAPSRPERGALPCSTLSKDCRYMRWWSTASWSWCRSPRVGLIAIAVRPSWRKPYAPLVAILATVGLALVPVATKSGEKLEERVNAGGVVAEQIKDHEDMARLVIWPTLAMWVLAVVMLVMTRQGRTGRQMTVVAVLSCSPERRPRRWSRSPDTSGRRPCGSAPSAADRLSRPRGAPGCAAAAAASPAAPGSRAPRRPSRPARSPARRGCTRAGSPRCPAPGRGRRG